MECDHSGLQVSYLIQTSPNPVSKTCPPATMTVKKIVIILRSRISITQPELTKLSWLTGSEEVMVGLSTRIFDDLSPPKRPVLRRSPLFDRNSDTGCASRANAGCAR